MRPSTWTDAHTDLLRRARPDVPETSEADLDHGWHRVAAGIGAGDPRGRTPRSRRRLAVASAALAAAVAVGVSGVAAADLFSARTGEGPIDAEDLRLGGPGERLDMAAPDLGAVIAEESTDIPFPSDRLRQVSLRRHVRENAVDPGSETVQASVGAFRAWIAADAVCAWVDRWAVATRRGDPATRAEAAATVRGASEWAAVTGVDPAPYRRWRTMDLLGPDGTTERTRYLDESQFAWLGPLAEGVAGTDVGAVAVRLGEEGRCRPDMVPDLPRADPAYRDR